MSGTGRKLDEIWKYYDKIVIPGRKGSRASCKKCGSKLEGQAARLKRHYSKCNLQISTGA